MNGNVDAPVQDHSYIESRFEPETCGRCHRKPSDHRYFIDPAGPLQDPQWRMP